MSIPVILVTGYLGSGKTTLINDFLRNPQGLRATVLVNDFGAINIDASLIENSDGDTISLTNGCACCAIGDDLLAAARRATDATVTRVPDLLLVEASGVSEPSRMVMLLRGVSKLDPAKILTLINGATAARNVRDKFIGRLFRSQIASAHFVALNRIDGHEDFVVRLLGEVSHAITVESLADTLSSQSIGSVRLSSNVSALPEFHSRVFDLENPVSTASIYKWCEALPDHVHRAKGIVETWDGLQELNYCQGITTLVPAPIVTTSVAQKVVVVGTQPLRAIANI